jgi:hypothetical protein
MAIIFFRQDAGSQEKIPMNQAWKALCEFVKHPYPVDHDPREPWEVTTTPPRPKTKTRNRKMTLARAMKQATKAGLAVASATVKPDGIELELGGRPTSQEVNEWDAVVKQ